MSSSHERPVQSPRHTSYIPAAPYPPYPATSYNSYNNQSHQNATAASSTQLAPAYSLYSNLPPHPMVGMPPPHYAMASYYPAVYLRPPTFPQQYVAPPAQPTTYSYPNSDSLPPIPTLPLESKSSSPSVEHYLPTVNSLEDDAHIASRRVFVAGLPADYSKVAMLKLLHERLSIQEKDTVGVEMRTSPFEDNSFTFIEVTCKNLAAQAVQALENTRIGPDKFIRACVCEEGENHDRLRSLFISNAPGPWRLEQFRENLAKYGTIRDIAYFPERRYGFVHFFNPDDGRVALWDLNGRIVLKRRLEVEVAHVHNSLKRREPVIKRKELAAAINSTTKTTAPTNSTSTTITSVRSKYDPTSSVQEDHVTASNYGNNLNNSFVLHVKNLDDVEVPTTAALAKYFSGFGTLTHCRLETYPGTSISKGFGFVWYQNKIEAETALGAMDKLVIGSKRIFVNWAEKKEDRQRRLREFFQNQEFNGSQDEISNPKSTPDSPPPRALDIDPQTPKNEPQKSPYIVTPLPKKLSSSECLRTDHMNTAGNYTKHALVVDQQQFEEYEGALSNVYGQGGRPSSEADYKNLSIKDDEEMKRPKSASRIHSNKRFPAMKNRQE